MRRAVMFPYLGPALVLYLIADVAASRGGLDAFDYAIALVACLLSLAFLRRPERNDEHGATPVAYLGFALAVASLRWFGTDVRITIDVAQSVATVAASALTLDLAWTVPDRIGSARWLRWSRVGLGVTAALIALGAVLSVGPELLIAGRTWIVPAHFAHGPLAFAALCFPVALGYRLLRRRLGSTPEALAANHWAVLALLPCTLFLGAVVVAHAAGTALARPVACTLLGASALALYLGHASLIDERRRLVASGASREILTGALSIALVSLLVAMLRDALPSAPAVLALATAAILCAAVALHQGLRPLVRRALAPASGRLLDALEGLTHSVGEVHALPDLVHKVLWALRSASGAPGAQPLLYGFDPAFEGRIDAAGEPHLSQRELPAVIRQTLVEAPGEIIVSAPLVAQIVRKPRLRPLVEALTEYDVLCVLPLVCEGELEGALLVPRGSRRAQLTLEELSALTAHARWLAAFLSVFAARSRAERRAETLLLSQRDSVERAERLADEVARLQTDIEALHDGRLSRDEAAPLIAYGSASRELVRQVRAHAPLDVPLLFLAEDGLSIEPLARLAHAESGRAKQPFLIVDCARLRAEHCASALFGCVDEQARQIGAVSLAGEGTLCLLDVVALPLSVQRALALALASRSYRAEGSVQVQTLSARVIASTRVPLPELVLQQAFDAELCERLSSSPLRLPPLRERPEDIASHALLAVDCAARRLGRAPLGFEPDALQQLCSAPWPGNVAELEQLLERAVARAQGPRLRLEELLLSGGEVRDEGKSQALDGTLEQVERRVIERALSRAAGNKSEAARLLGLPRTTLIDKVRRHKLDETPGDTSSAPPN